MEDVKYWGNPKVYKLNLYSGLSFLFVGPIYGIYSIGLGLPQLIIVILLCGIPALFFLNIYRKYKNNPVLITDKSSITVNDPFSKAQVVPLDSIKSVSPMSNGGIRLETIGKPKAVHIAAKVLFENDRQQLMEFLNENNRNS